jgi:hypothetical protein
LLSLTERRVRHNFEGLISALQLAPAQATTLVRSHPTLLRSSPALLAARRAMLRELLEVRLRHYWIRARAHESVHRI